MNKVTASSEYNEGVSAHTSDRPQKPKAGGPEAKRESAPARKADIIELHNRVATMLTQLNDGLVGAAEKKLELDSSKMDSRIGEMQAAIDGLEGAVRVELTPSIRELLKEEFRRQNTKKRASIFFRVFQLCVVIGLLFLGAVYSEQILQFADTILEQIFLLQEKIVPLWGHLFSIESF